MKECTKLQRKLPRRLILHESNETERESRIDLVGGWHACSDLHSMTMYGMMAVICVGGCSDMT